MRLYQVVRDFAELKGDDVVYDLYTGTGTIALFLARQVSKVIGIEYVPEAIKDAQINAEMNEISNAEFLTGDMKDVLGSSLFEQYGQPDLIVLDPPRAGVHPDVITAIRDTDAPRIVYVSCNPATQARDLALLSDRYAIQAVQPVDMFPHTHHVENVVLLKKY
jgi:23S rRNA (uracil1939-C5)-methyltransferase